MGGLAWWRLKKWRWHALLLLTIVPLAIGASLLQLLGPVGDPLSGSDLSSFKSALSESRFLPGILTLVAVLSVHVCICLCGIGLAWGMLRSQPPARPRLAWFGFGLALLVGAGLVLLVWLGPSGGPSVYQASYGFFDRLYRGTGAGRALLQPGFAGIDALGWAVLIPTVIGVLGVGVTTAAAAGELRALPEPPPLPEPLYEAKLQNVQGRLKRLLYVLTIGLVTSTVAVSIFFHLPSKLSQEAISWQPPAFSGGVATADKEGLTAAAELSEARARVEKLRAAELDGSRARLDDFAGELSIFWGAVFTLTLLATGAVPQLLLQRKVRLYSENSRDAAALDAAQKRLGDSGLLSGGLDQVKLIGAVVAPLASGPISHFVQLALGG
jgi:hypothetical protein